MLKRAIALEVGVESVVRDNGLVSAFSDDCKIVQILVELFVVADWKNDGGALAVVICEVLEWLAHAGTLRRSARMSNACSDDRRTRCENVALLSATLRASSRA